MPQERNHLQDCEIGDWVLCGSEFPGANGLKVRRADWARTLAEQDAPPTPSTRNPGVMDFKRRICDGIGVIKAWVRVE